MICWFVLGWIEVFGKYIDYVGGFILVVVVDCGVMILIELGDSGIMVLMDVVFGELFLVVGYDLKLLVGYWGRYV